MFISMSFRAQFFCIHEFFFFVSTKKNCANAFSFLGQPQKLTRIREENDKIPFSQTYEHCKHILFLVSQRHEEPSER